MNQTELGQDLCIWHPNPLPKWEGIQLSHSASNIIYVQPICSEIKFESVDSNLGVEHNSQIIVSNDSSIMFQRVTSNIYYSLSHISCLTLNVFQF